MTIGKFIGFALLLWVYQAVIKVVFIKVLGLESQYLEYLYWFLIAAFSIALVRRLGHINILEGVLVAFFWFLVGLVMDFIVTSPIVGSLLASRWEVWVGYLAMLIAIIFFHKKRHIKIRHERQGRPD